MSERNGNQTKKIKKKNFWIWLCLVCVKKTIQFVASDIEWIQCTELSKFNSVDLSFMCVIRWCSVFFFRSNDFILGVFLSFSLTWIPFESIHKSCDTKKSSHRYAKYVHMHSEIYYVIKWRDIFAMKRFHICRY